jgi:ABC-type transport system substrate-binding protein
LAEIRSYWDRFTASRLSRRRALQAGAAAGAGAIALSLIGCGGGDESGDASGLLYTPTDTSNKATKGGSLPLTSGTVSAFDQVNDEDTTQGLHAYSRLLKFKTYKYPDKVLNEVEPEFATGYEFSPDGLRLTFKLRPNLKLDPRSPTNGRMLNSGDVAWSWQRYEKQNAFKANLSAASDPTAPFVGFETPDANTFVFKLAFPYTGVLQQLAYKRHLPIMPVEAESKFDVRNEVRGSSAWRLKEYVPSARVVWEKNPDWYDTAKINTDTITYYMSSEYATNLAQFRSGALATLAVNAEDVLQTKRDLPHLLMKPSDNIGNGDGSFRFGYIPGSPFLDVRTRRALSMLWDRDLYIDTFGNTKAFEDAGLAIEKRWNSAIVGSWPWWLDPKSKEFGPESAVYFHNPAEAKKLMEAAGHTKPLDLPFSLRTESGESYYRSSEVLQAMMNDSGLFNFHINIVDYRSEWRPKYHYGFNKHEGLARISGGDGPEIDPILQAWWKSGQETGADRRGHVLPDLTADNFINDLIAKQRIEPDTNKRQELLNEFQRYAAKQAYMFWGPGDSTSFEMANPWLGNWGAFNSGRDQVSLHAIEVYPHYWIDQSKRA